MFSAYRKPHQYPRFHPYQGFRLPAADPACVPIIPLEPIRVEPRRPNTPAETAKPLRALDPPPRKFFFGPKAADKPRFSPWAGRAASRRHMSKHKSFVKPRPKVRATKVGQPPVPNPQAPSGVADLERNMQKLALPRYAAALTEDDKAFFKQMEELRQKRDFMITLTEARNQADRGREEAQKKYRALHKEQEEANRLAAIKAEEERQANVNRAKLRRILVAREFQRKQDEKRRKEKKRLAEAERKAEADKKAEADRKEAERWAEAARRAAELQAETARKAAELQAETARKAAELQAELNRQAAEKEARVREVRERNKLLFDFMEEENERCRRQVEERRMRGFRPEPRPQDPSIGRFALYNDKWRALKAQTATYAFRTFPWPVLHDVRSVSDITPQAVEQFLRHPLRPDAASIRDRLRTELLRWHPDKFTSITLETGVYVQKEMVREGANEVARILTQMFDQIG